MLSAKTNDIRNQIMQKFKYEQKKRRNLREFLRTEKAKIIIERGGPNSRELERKEQAII